MLKFKVGDIITSISSDTQTGSVLIVGKVGRRYLSVRGQDMHPDATLWQIDLTATNRIILAGDRTDVLERLNLLRAEYAQAYQQRQHERSEAVWAFERRWDLDHPYPPYTTGDYIRQLQEEEKL